MFQTNACPFVTKDLRDFLILHQLIKLSLLIYNHFYGQVKNVEMSEVLFCPYFQKTQVLFCPYFISITHSPYKRETYVTHPTVYLAITNLGQGAVQTLVPRSFIFNKTFISLNCSSIFGFISSSRILNNYMIGSRTS